MRVRLTCINSKNVKTDRNIISGYKILESWFRNSGLECSTTAKLWTIKSKCHWKFFLLGPGTPMEKVSGNWDFYTGSWGKFASIRSKRQKIFVLVRISQDSGIIIITNWPCSLNFTRLIIIGEEFNGFYFCLLC